MGNFSKHTSRMDIYLEEDRKTILVRQRWKYNWLKDSGTTAWTYMEKKKYHNTVDNLIWQQWGGQYKIKVTGTSDFAKRNSTIEFTLNFDIQWELSKPHWEVNVTKIPIGKFKQSNVVWNRNEINLDTEDTVLTKKAAGHFQYPVSHEYGHAIGNSAYAYTGGHGDEYKSGSSYFSDKSSIMNVGNTLRERHIDFLLRELNTMFPPSTVFVFKSIN